MKRTVNLRSPLTRTRRLVCSRLLALEMGCLLFAVSIVGGAFWQKNLMLEQNVLRLEQEQKKLEPMRARQQEIDLVRQENMRKQQLYTEWKKQDVQPDGVLTKIAVAMPPSVWLQEIKQQEKDKTVTLKGFALTMDDIARFVEKLTASPEFDGAEIKDVSRDAKQTIQFELLLKGKG